MKLRKIILNVDVVVVDDDEWEKKMRRRRRLKHLWTKINWVINDDDGAEIKDDLVWMTRMYMNTQALEHLKILHRFIFNYTRWVLLL